MNFSCRFILDTFFYCLFLGFILHSVLDGIGNSENEEATWSLCYVSLWVFCYILRDLKNMVRSVQGDKNLVSFRFGYDLTLHILLSIAIVFKVSVMYFVHSNKLFVMQFLPSKYFSLSCMVTCFFPSLLLQYSLGTRE